MTHGLILVIDDESGMRDLLQAQLTIAGYEVLSARNGREGLAVLQCSEPDLVLCDLEMPECNGLEFLQALELPEHRRDVPPPGIVILTGHDEVASCVRTMRLGALDYLVKPFDRASLLGAIERNMALQRDRVIVWRAEQERSLSFELRESRNSLPAMRAGEEQLNSLVTALDARERETQYHCQRTSRYAEYLAQSMGLDKDECEVIRRGALVHDIGKIGVSDQVLLKSGPLSPDDMREMQRHTETGYAILRNLSHFERESEIALAHHERFDGSGYPRGLREDEIPFSARLFAVIDTFDAITSDRPYRPARSYAEAAAEILAGAGTQFDPEIVHAFLAVPPDTWTRIAGEVRAARYIAPQ